jgi:hypothetical protein
MTGGSKTLADEMETPPVDVGLSTTAARVK